MARKSSLKKKKSRPNLLPVMNIMFLMIPALLLAMEIAKMAAIVVSPPKFAAAPPDQKEEEKLEEKPWKLKVSSSPTASGRRPRSSRRAPRPGRHKTVQVPGIPLAKPSAPMDDYSALRSTSRSKPKESYVKSKAKHETTVTLSAGERHTDAGADQHDGCGPGLGLRTDDAGKKTSRCPRSACSSNPSSKPEPAEQEGSYVMAEMTPEELFLLKQQEKEGRAPQSGRREKAALGMTSLMDIVSIIVAYLLKSYASDLITITPIAEQKIPDVEEWTRRSQRRKRRHLRLSAAQLALLATSPSRSSPKASRPQRRAGTRDSAAVREARGRDREIRAVFEPRGEEWIGHIILIGDEAVKFSTLVDIMYTAGRLEYSEYSFCVIQRNV